MATILSLKQLMGWHSTSDSFKKTEREWKEKKESNEFKRNLDYQIKSKGR